MQQLDLLSPAAFRERPTSPAPARPDRILLWVQLDLLSPEWLNRREDPEEDDDPFVSSPVVHRLVLALEAEPPQTTGVRSIFDLPSLVLAKPCRPAKPEPPPAERYGVTTREVGVVRHTARRYDETEEWAEKERQRRARQRVPKPTKRARTRGRKLLDLIGTEE